MDFQEFGNLSGKTFVLLPGTACTWQLNFKNVIDELAKKFHIIAVNYDGFEGDKTKIFTDMLTVTQKIENYILKNHNGKVDGVYGSSLGGSFVGLLVQRNRIHIEHGFIGSSDLDQGCKFYARFLCSIIGFMFSGACKSEKKRNALKSKFQKKRNISKDELSFGIDFVDNMKNLNPKTITKEFYSDYITPLEDSIFVEGTIIHIIYALKMGEKYKERYLKHFKNPDIHEFDMQHEGWLNNEKWRQPVLDCIYDCMEVEK